MNIYVLFGVFIFISFIIFFMIRKKNKKEIKLIDRENAIRDFPPFTEQEIDEALDILEIVKELYKHRC